MAVSVTISPLMLFQFNQNNLPLAGGKLFTYAAGTTNKLATYTDSTGAVPNTNPIILDANGQCTCWLQNGLAYKFTLSPSTDTDPPTNPFWTEDNITPSQNLTLPLSISQGGTGSTTRAGSFASIVAPGGTMTGALNDAPPVALTATATPAVGAAASNNITISGNPITASINGTVLTVTVGSGIAVGQYVFGTNVLPNQQISSFGTGAGGAGTYNLTLNNGTVISESMTTAPAVTGFDIIAAGARRYVTWSTPIPVTNNSTSFQLVGNASRVNNAGDMSQFVSLGSGNWFEEMYTPKIGAGTASQNARRGTVLIGPADVTGMPSLLPQTVTGLNLTTQNIASTEVVLTSNVLTPVASPGVVTWTGHSLVGNQAVSFTTNGALPTGLTAGTAYYVVPASITTNTFQVSAAPGGAAINFTGATSGQSVAWAGAQNQLIVSSFNAISALGDNSAIGVQNSNITWTGLPNNSTVYLYVTISNGVVSPAFTTLAPVIQYESITQPSATSGQITQNLLEGENYLGNGTTAVETSLVIIGTATTSGGNITATQAYNYGKPPTFASRLSNSLLVSTTYSTAGTFTWVKSAQTTSIRVRVRGGGAAGGAGGAGGAGTAQAGGGGGGGQGGYAEGVFDASTFNSQTVTLAAGGTSSFGSLISSTAGGVGTAGTNNSPISGQGGARGGFAGGSIGLFGQGGISGGFSATAGSGVGGTGGGEGGSVGGASQTTGTTNGLAGGAGSNGGGGGGGSGGNGNGNTGGAGGAASVGWITVEEFL